MTGNDTHTQVCTVKLNIGGPINARKILSFKVTAVRLHNPQFHIVVDQVTSNMPAVLQADMV